MTSKNTPSVADGSSTGQPDLLMCILSYLGIFALVPFFLKKDDPYISWHARQGVLLMIVGFAVMAVGMVLSMVPVVNMIAMPLLGLLSLALFGLSIFCMVQAYQGKKWPIPVLSGFLGKVPTAK
jgi:uncharacterized membrane protein